MKEEYKLINELKEPSVIYEKDPEDPNNPQVLVKGVGVYRLKTLEKNVREKMEDIGKRGVKAYTFEDWKQVQYMLDHSAMNEMIKTIILAKKEIGGIKESWFASRENEVTELKAFVERLNKVVKRQEGELAAAYEKIDQLEGKAKPRSPFSRRAGPFSKSDI